ncbi:hypothetical protein BH23PLA1_BH23PLA1_29330 [soil metagenome]
MGSYPVDAGETRSLRGESVSMGSKGPVRFGLNPGRFPGSRSWVKRGRWIELGCLCRLDWSIEAAQQGDARLPPTERHHGSARKTVRSGQDSRGNRGGLRMRMIGTSFSVFIHRGRPRCNGIHSRSPFFPGGRHSGHLERNVQGYFDSSSGDRPRNIHPACRTSQRRSAIRESGGEVTKPGQACENRPRNRRRVMVAKKAFTTPYLPIRFSVILAHGGSDDRASSGVS